MFSSHLSFKHHWLLLARPTLQVTEYAALLLVACFLHCLRQRRVRMAGVSRSSLEAWKHGRKALALKSPAMQADDVDIYDVWSVYSGPPP